jgi:hypothetical protein
MASKIKKFFKSKKNEAKFKLGMAGPGHRLGDAPSSSSQQAQHSPRPAPTRVTPSSEAQQAAAAALARMEQRSSDKPAFNTYNCDRLYRHGSTNGHFFNGPVIGPLKKSVQHQTMPLWLH